MKLSMDDFIEQYYGDDFPEPNDYYCGTGPDGEACCLTCETKEVGCWCDECGCKSCHWYDEALTKMSPCTLVTQWKAWRERSIKFSHSIRIITNEGGNPKIALYFMYNKEKVESVKSLPKQTKRMWNKENDYWELEPSTVTLELLGRIGFDASKEVVREVNRIELHQERLRLKHLHNKKIEKLKKAGMKDISKIFGA